MNKNKKQSKRKSSLSFEIVSAASAIVSPVDNNKPPSEDDRKGTTKTISSVKDEILSQETSFIENKPADGKQKSLHQNLEPSQRKDKKTENLSTRNKNVHDEVNDGKPQEVSIHRKSMYQQYCKKISDSNKIPVSGLQVKISDKSEGKEIKSSLKNHPTVQIHDKGNNAKSEEEGMDSSAIFLPYSQIASAAAAISLPLDNTRTSSKDDRRGIMKKRSSIIDEILSQETSFIGNKTADGKQESPTDLGLSTREENDGTCTATMSSERSAPTQPNHNSQETSFIENKTADGKQELLHVNLGSSQRKNKEIENLLTRNKNIHDEVKDRKPQEVSIRRESMYHQYHKKISESNKTLGGSPEVKISDKSEGKEIESSLKNHPTIKIHDKGNNAKSQEEGMDSRAIFLPYSQIASAAAAISLPSDNNRTSSKDDKRGIMKKRSSVIDEILSQETSFIENKTTDGKQESLKEIECQIPSVKPPLIINKKHRTALSEDVKQNKYGDKDKIRRDLFSDGTSNQLCDNSIGGDLDCPTPNVTRLHDSFDQREVQRVPSAMNKPGFTRVPGIYGWVPRPIQNITENNIEYNISNENMLIIENAFVPKNTSETKDQPNDNEISEVNEEADTEIIIRQEQLPLKKKIPKLYYFLPAILTVLGCFAIYYFAGPSAQPTVPKPPAPQDLEYFNKVYAEVIILSGEKALSNKTSPQYQAFERIITLASEYGPVDYRQTDHIQIFYVLYLVYIQLNGKNWKNNKNWFSNTDYCGYCEAQPHSTLSGITCYKPCIAASYENVKEEVVMSYDIETRKIEVLDLSYNNIVGKIPPEIFGISINSMHLSNNPDLRGTIPVEIANAIHMNSLDLQRTNMHGTIPKELGSCKKLDSIKLSWNNFSGQLPKELGNIYKLRNLILHSNKFTGTIPEEYGKLTRLKKFEIYGNRLDGPIPDSVCELTESRKLEKIKIDCNDAGNFTIGCNCCVCKEHWGGMLTP